MKQTAIFTGIIWFLSGIIITFFAVHSMMMWGYQHINHEEIHETDKHNNLAWHRDMIHNMQDDPHAHHDADDHWDMSMREMSTMLEWLSGDMLDKMFLEGMIPHHQAAIDMARYLENSQREELQNLWREIIEVQQAEIEMMQNWLREWEL